MERQSTTATDAIQPANMLKPNRKITGMSAILLPFFDNGDIDWSSLRKHIERTVEAGLVPAVNMDTGYANLIDQPTREKVLSIANEVVGAGEYLAGAFVSDNSGDDFRSGDYRKQIDSISEHSGTPIVFQSYGLAHGTDDAIVANYAELAAHCDRFYAFELGTMFAPFGNIYSLDVYRELMKLPQCVGAKHSSLRRDLEWQRLQARDADRPDFMVLTGNDLAIDMVVYGSDYLLGLSTFCPDIFAKRDAMWAVGDPGFYELNDVLQYLGFLAFRNPTSAYKHSAAMFLKLRGWIESDLTHPDSPTRPESDRDILREIGSQLDLSMAAN